jgi:hypothetical protein
VSTLHKQNFDLKLELYHRRQRQEALETRLEAALKQIAEQAELQEVNEQLLAELEKRDQAVEEAVGMIVTLEDKVERLMKDREHVRSFEQNDSGYFRSSHSDGPPSSPLEFEKGKLAAPKGLLRMPSFLTDTTEGTEALRGLYLPHSQSFSDATLPKLQEGTADGMNSPRLSVLSKSSFLSVYGEKPLVLDQEEEVSPTRRHRASSSVEKWVAAPVATPVRLAPGLPKTQFLSINDIVESPLQKLEKLKLTMEKQTQILTRQPERATSVKDNRKSREILRRVFTDKASYEQQQDLPPTPDTISTSTLRHYQNSNDILAQDHGKEGIFLNSTSIFPVPRTTQHAYQSTLSVRPRSAGETVTSRREGHGWDTETQDDMTDTASVSSTASYSAQYCRPKRVMTPNLFMFDGGDSWGRDMMYNNESSLPPHTGQRYDHLRRASMVEHPRSDDTVLPYNSTVTQSGNASQFGTTLIDISPRPELPDRRSSLSATTKFRKSNPGSIASTQASTGSPVFANSKDGAPKKNRLTNGLRLFGRSETSPMINSGSQASENPGMRPKTNVDGRGQNYYEVRGFEEEELARATPPPIKRSRPGHLVAYRPSSAGAGATGRSEEGNRVAQAHGRRGSIGMVVVGDANAGNEDEKIGNGGGRKWFGMARAGSLRRT